MTLDALAVKHGTDKGSEHPRLTPKRYTEVYSALLPSNVRRLLELGIAKGASLRMWAEHFLEAIIVGIDKGPLPEFHEPNVRLFRGRQEDAELLGRVSAAYGPWDVVIDDGSHIARDQVASLKALWPHLANGGIYAVEDLHAPNACTVHDLEAIAGVEAEVSSLGRLAVLRKP